MSSVARKVKKVAKKAVDASVQVATLGQLDSAGAEALVDDFTGETAAKEADRRADRQRDQDMLELNEQLRRTDLANEQKLGRARAMAGASGAKYSGSTAGYVEEMSKNFSVERDWMRRAGLSQAQNRWMATHEQGKAAKRGRRVSLVSQGGSMLLGGK